MKEVKPIQVHVYPNPTSDVVYLYLNESESRQLRTLDIFNAQGKIVFRQERPDGDNRIRLSVSSFPAGVYTVRVISAIGENTQVKFVKVN